MFSRQKQMNDMPGYPDNSWPSPKVDLNESLNSDSETQSNEISRLLNNLDYHIENDVSFNLAFINNIHMILFLLGNLSKHKIVYMYNHNIE